MIRFEKLGSLALIAALAGVSSSVTGCAGKTAFNVTPTSQIVAAPGSTLVPPKVDFLLVTDDTGSAYEAYDALSQQVPLFLNQLDQVRWDYHFASIPLTSYRSVDQVVGSTFDSNRGSEWTPAYPGQLATDSGMVASSVFRLPSQFSQIWGTITNNLNGLEPGFANIKSVIESGLNGTNFMRNDAMLVVLVVGNGNDTSGVNFCKRGDGVTVVCSDGSEGNSFNQYKSWFSSLKPSAAGGTQSNIKFFSAVAQRQTSNCLGGGSVIGDRYNRMASALGGQSYDVCTQPINQVLSSLTSSLQSTRMNFRTRYLFLDQEPELKSIKVTRYLNGDTNSARVIAEDPINGWTYAGKLQDAYAIDYPIPMNQGSGYAIELHGTARLIGSDTAAIDATPAGAQNSVSK